MRVSLKLASNYCFYFYVYFKLVVDLENCFNIDKKIVYNIYKRY